jgi:DNA polymerase I-like protein with 3'-5' exonuclease and polymerase domains
MKLAVLDIETNLSHDTIWMAGVYLPAQNASVHCATSSELSATLKDVDGIIGHNLLSFDLPVLHRVWGWEWTGTVYDTMVMGRLLNPPAEGGHSLKAWALRAGKELKDEFDVADFDKGLTDEMIRYCLQDCRANWDVYEHIVAELDRQGFSQQCRDLEHDVAKATALQIANGFAFDFPTACNLYCEHEQRMREIEAELQAIFPPIVEERWSEKTGKRLKDSVTVFNVGSRPQVAKRLAQKGAVWKDTTPTGQPKVDESTLKQNEHIPEAALVLEYLTLQKRYGMLKNWLDAVQDDGRIHGRVNTCGAVTGRMTHSSPNMAQIPSDSLYRQCFVVPEGSKLVGIDASGLELRMLAHYMDDPEYTDLILNGDIHTYNQQAAGLDTRPQAKTFIYAFLYGAGDAKIGSIVGGSSRKGAQLKQRFLDSLPALLKLINKVARHGLQGSLPGLDGRRVLIRSEHAALNTLLQSAGAIVMKQALVLATNKLARYGYPYKLVAQVHDEFQVEVPEEYAQQVGAVFRNAIREAGRTLELRCPLDGEYKIGNNWSETH